MNTGKTSGELEIIERHLDVRLGGIDGPARVWAYRREAGRGVFDSFVAKEISGSTGWKSVTNSLVETACSYRVELPEGELTLQISTILPLACAWLGFREDGLLSSTDGPSYWQMVVRRLECNGIGIPSEEILRKESRPRDSLEVGVGSYYERLFGVGISRPYPKLDEDLVRKSNWACHSCGFISHEQRWEGPIALGTTCSCCGARSGIEDLDPESHFDRWAAHGRLWATPAVRPLVWDICRQLENSSWWNP